MRAFKPNAMTLHDRDVMGSLPGIQQVILDRPIASARAQATSSKTKLFSLEQFHATPADDEQKRFQDAADKEKTQKEDAKEDIRVHGALRMARCARARSAGADLTPCCASFAPGLARTAQPLNPVFWKAVVREANALRRPSPTTEATMSSPAAALAAVAARGNEN